MERKLPEAKFKIGDKAWVMQDNKPTETEINGVILKDQHHLMSYLYYFLKFNDKEIHNYGWIEESKLFATKEELISTL